MVGLAVLSIIVILGGVWKWWDVFAGNGDSPPVSWYVPGVLLMLVGIAGLATSIFAQS